MPLWLIFRTSHKSALFPISVAMTTSLPSDSAVTSSNLTRFILAQAEDQAHVLEECRINRFSFAPIIPPDDPFLKIKNTFVMVLNLDGSTAWRRHQNSSGSDQPSPDDCILAPHHFTAFPCESDLAAARVGTRTGHFLLWRVRLDAMQAIDSVLGADIPPSPPPPSASSEKPKPRKEWPLAGPFPLSPVIRNLVASLRSAPRGPMRTLWFGAKLVELIALLHPPSESFPASDGGEEGDKALRLHSAVETAMHYIEGAFHKPLSLVEIATEARVTPSYLSHLFTVEVGETLSSYLRRVRLERASQLIRDGECNASEAAKAVGYSSIGQFSHAFRAHFGHPPGQHAQRGHRIRQSSHPLLGAKI